MCLLASLSPAEEGGDGFANDDDEDWAAEQAGVVRWTPLLRAEDECYKQSVDGVNANGIDCP